MASYKKPWDVWICLLCLLLQHSNASLEPPSSFSSSASPTSRITRNGLHSEDPSLRRKLSTLNRPAVKTIQGPHGDTIDCVPLDQQPAFDHPSLKGHKIKLQPSARPWSSRKGENWNSTAGGGGGDGRQAWREHGACPKGTVAIRRTSSEDILRASSLESFGRKSNAHQVRRSQKPFARRDQTSPTGHDHAIAYVSGGEYYGATATMNVWEPSVESSSEFSLSQMWILSGSFGSDLNTIEAGWQVSPELYGDNRPRFFIYWTADAYQQTGCYNLLCSGFVQTSSEIAMGAAISPWSTFKGAQYDIKVLIWKDPQAGDWWMEFGDRTLIGYWPARLFTHLGKKATVVEWGGEVAQSTIPSSLRRHTSTHMGSGRFAGDGFAHASYFRNVEVVSTNNQLQTISKLATSADHPSCYNILSYYNSGWGNFFYYGGPGRNPSCP